MHCVFESAVCNSQVHGKPFCSRWDEVWAAAQRWCEKRRVLKSSAFWSLVLESPFTWVALRVTCASVVLWCVASASGQPGSCLYQFLRCIQPLPSIRLTSLMAANWGKRSAGREEIHTCQQDSNQLMRCVLFGMILQYFCTQKKWLLSLDRNNKSYSCFDRSISPWSKQQSC